MQKQPSPADSFTGLSHNIKKLGLLYIEKARLKATDKITILLSSMAFTAMIIVLTLVLLIFVSLGVGHLLATSISPHMAYLYVAGFYLILLIGAVMCRKKLIIDPISRFISRLLIDPPADNENIEDEAKEKDVEAPRAVEIDYNKLAEHVVSRLQGQRDDIQPTEIIIIEEEGGES